MATENSFSLSDFDTSSSGNVSLDDLQLNKDRVAPLTPMPSIRNLAALNVASSSSPEDAQNNYEQVVAETSAEGQSVLGSQLRDKARQDHQAYYKNALVSVLADPNISIEAKDAAVNKVYNKDSSLYSETRILQSGALSAPVANENAEEESRRSYFANVLDHADNVRRQQQQALNAAMALHDSETTDKIGDFLQGLIPFNEQLRVGSQLTAMGENPFTAYAKAILAPGSTKEDIRRKIQDAPLEDRLDLTEKLIDVVNTHPGILTSDNNDFVKLQGLQEYIADGGYDAENKWVDNVMGAIDLIGLGSSVYGIAKNVATKSAAKSAAKAEAKAAESSSDAFYEAQNRYTKGGAQPSSLSALYKDTNVDGWRAAHGMAASAADDSVAEATHGVSKADAVMGDIAPDIGNPNGSVNAKPSAPDAHAQAEYGPDPDVFEIANTRGASEYMQKEKANLRAKVVTDFQQALGLTSRDNMFTVHHVGNDEVADGVKISGIYAPPVSGYSNPTDAIELAKWAFRKYGIDDSNISIMKRDGTQYVPIDSKELQAHQSYFKALEAQRNSKTLTGDQVKLLSGPEPVSDYVVKVDYHYKFSAGDLKDEDWGVATTSRAASFMNFYNTEGKRGTLASHVLDPASIQDPVVIKSAVVSEDKAARVNQIMLQKIHDIVVPLRKMPVERRTLMTNMWAEGNAKGIRYTRAQLQIMGLTEDEIKIHQNFRKFWDSMHHFDNRDLATTLRNQGYQEFYHPEADSSLIAKPVGKLSGSVRVLDPTTDEMKTLTQAEIDSLYEKGGTVARLKDVVNHGAEYADHIVVSQTPGNGYLRGINDDTKILHYREGYYRVSYRDPWIIDKVIKDGSGNVIGHKAVATAPDLEKAKILQRRYSTVNNEEHIYRKAREMSLDDQQRSEWDLQTTGGRGSQRYRGKKLEDGTWYTQNVDQMNIKNPVEVMVDAARSMSQRIGTRSQIEVTKARILANGADYLPKDKFGQTVLPRDLREVKYRRSDKSESQEVRRQIDSIRSQINYVNMLEHGYVNSIDDGVKSMFHNIADAIGDKGLSRGERALRKAGEFSPINAAKSVSYLSYIATSPLRQFIVQAHQAVLTVAVNPGWVASMRGPAQMMWMMTRHVADGRKIPSGMMNYFKLMTGETPEGLEKMYKQFVASGQVAAIDRHALVKGASLDNADILLGQGRIAEGPAGKVVGQVERVAKGTLSVVKKVGFDAGEFVNTTASYLAFRDLALKAGKNLDDPAVLEELAAQARNYTGNMNRAGDLDYQLNELSLPFQYMQNAHKMFLNMISNRSLSKQQKIALITTNLALTGLGTSLAYNGWFSKYLPEDPVVRDAVSQGIEGATLNLALTNAFGPNAAMDWGSLAPTNAYGTLDTLTGFITGSPGETLANMPSTQLLFGNNPRMTNAARMAARFLHLDVKDQEDPVTFGQVLNEALKISSGYSSGLQAALVVKNQEVYSKTGKLIQNNFPSELAPLIAAGFPTLQQSVERIANNEAYKNYEAAQEDIKKAYSDCKSRIAGIQNPEGKASQEEFDAVQRTYACIFGSIGEQTSVDYVHQEVQKLMIRDLKAGDGNNFASMVYRQADLMDPDTLVSWINAHPGLDATQKQGLTDFVMAAKKSNDDAAKSIKDTFKREEE